MQWSFNEAWIDDSFFNHKVIWKNLSSPSSDEALTPALTTSAAAKWRIYAAQSFANLSALRTSCKVRDGWNRERQHSSKNRVLSSGSECGAEANTAGVRDANEVPSDLQQFIQPHCRTQEAGQGSRELCARSCEAPLAPCQQTPSTTPWRRAAQYLTILANWLALCISRRFGLYLCCDQRGGCNKGKASLSLACPDNAAEKRHRFQCGLHVHSGCYGWPCLDTHHYLFQAARIPNQSLSRHCLTVALQLWASQRDNLRAVCSSPRWYKPRVLSSDMFLKSPQAWKLFCGAHTQLWKSQPKGSNTTVPYKKYFQIVGWFISCPYWLVKIWFRGKRKQSGALSSFHC